MYQTPLRAAALQCLSALGRGPNLAVVHLDPAAGWTQAHSRLHYLLLCQSTSFVGDLQDGQDRATSALTRSKGLLLIVSPVMPAGVIANYIAMAHACNSSTHVKHY